MAPGVRHERMAVGGAGLVALHEGAGLRGGTEIGLDLDRPRPAEDLPMILAGLQREGGRQRDHFGAAVGQGLEQLRKAQVVADRAADRDTLAIIGDDRIARLNEALSLYSVPSGAVMSKRWIFR